MRPLVVTLESNSDLATQGLRTLELFVDNLAPDFFQPILNEVHSDLMMALWKHLKPAPSPHGTQALRIIGKLAGRNRRFLKDPLHLTSGEDSCDMGLRLTFAVEGTNVVLPFGRCASLTKRVLLSPLADEEAKKNAFTIQKSLLLSVFGLQKSPSSLEDAMISGGVGVTKTKKGLELSNRNILATDEILLQTLLTSLFIAYGSGEKMKEFTAPFFMDVCRHFAILFTYKKHTPTHSLVSLFSVLIPFAVVQT
jgi:transformation/transcription domain-associated protein